MPTPDVDVARILSVLDEAAGRPKDIQVVPALRAHLRRGGNGRGGH